MHVHCLRRFSSKCCSYMRVKPGESAAVDFWGRTFCVFHDAQISASSEALRPRPVWLFACCVGIITLLLSHQNPSNASTSVSIKVVLSLILSDMTIDVRCTAALSLPQRSFLPHTAAHPQHWMEFDVFHNRFPRVPLASGRHDDDVAGACQNDFGTYSSCNQSTNAQMSVWEIVL